MRAEGKLSICKQVIATSYLYSQSFDLDFLSLPCNISEFTQIQLVGIAVARVPSKCYSVLMFSLHNWKDPR